MFLCQSCGGQSPKWAGKCPHCNEWNTLVEEVIERKTRGVIEADTPGVELKTKGIKKLNELSGDDELRVLTPSRELNRVLGGGIVPGSLVLIGGEPGIGKSTLALQIVLGMQDKTILYVSGEESEKQISMRAKRLSKNNDNLYLFTETSTHAVGRALKKVNADLLVIDSIQTVHSPSLDSIAGSVSQIRECAAEIHTLAKQKNVPVFLIGHITKDGAIAGPKILEHIVDTVLQFEGDQNYNYRILRTTKNRYGSTSELGIFEMQQDGLREVLNPSEILITKRDELLSGIAISATIEGLRPMLIETQALASPSVYSAPQRTTTGFDNRRLNMLLAVLEKRCGFRFSTHDVFLNIAGGLRIDDPATDLAVVSALISSFKDEPLPLNYCFCGEVGLSGEIRAVNRVGQRIAEADKLGFSKIFVSKYNFSQSKKRSAINPADFKIEIVEVGKVADLDGLLFLGA